MMSATNLTNPAERNDASLSYHWTHILWPSLLIVIAWSIILFAASTNQMYLLDHDYLLRASHLPWLLALVAFLASWQIMTAAMMLPSTLSMISIIAYASRQQRHSWLMQVVFIAGYAAVWTAFALVTFVGDTLVHQLVNSWFWLYTHSWLLAVAILAIAGSSQFSPLKKHCLQQCSRPFSFCERHYRYGIGSAWYLGWRYGWSCLGSCWALMLIMFGIGVRSPLWMAMLAGVILLEKEVPGGQRLRSVIGVAFLLLGFLWLVFHLWY